MNLVLVANGILTRLGSDTGTGGLRNASNPLVTGIFSYMAPEGQAYPYIVFGFTGAANEDTFERDVIRYQVDIAVLVTRDTGGLTRASQIIDRIYGNANANGNVPTYGLHRHKLLINPDLTTWVSSTMRRIDQIEAHDLEHFQFIERYEFLCTNEP